MSLEENKALVRRLAEVINQGTLSIVDQVVSSDFVLHHASGRDFPKEVYSQNAVTLRNAFPDVNMALDDLCAEGDKVVCRYTITGTHKGAYQGIPPTGNTISIQGINIFRIADGKIAEIWSVFNMLEQMQQLGVIPPMGKR
jgi:steroid delta-isomerase-like uncharacterized protein